MGGVEDQSKKPVAEFTEVFSPVDVLHGLSALTETGAISLTPLAWTAEGERVEKSRTSKEVLDTEHTRAIFLAP